MRGYFGVGAERISKAMNLGAIIRTAHAFEASFVFTLNAHHRARDVNQSDTAKTDQHLPLYEWDDIDALRLPKGCALVGVELTPDATALPSFKHPLNTAYLFGPEKGDLSAAAQAKCDYIIKIPTKFCVNVSVAAALVMYDRTLCLGGYPPRPLTPGGPPAIKDWQSPPTRR